MKQTLYQILGVEPQATQEDIERAYRERLGAFEADQNRDPNMLIVLRQAKEVLADANQRAAYDAALANRAAPPPVEDTEPAKQAFIQKYGKWMAAGAVLMAFALWLGSDPPNAPKIGAPGTTAPIAQHLAGEVQQTNEPAPVAAVPAQEAVGDNPIVGQWSCYETVSGRSSRYDFSPDGTLTITEAGGRVLSHRYEAAENTLKLADATHANALTIEERTLKKMVLNTGTEGRRVVCKR